MKIIETLKKGKYSEELCEDDFVISDDFVAVIDGVTSKSDFLYQGKTTGKIAAEIVADVLGTAERKSSLKEIISAVNARFSEFYENVSFPYDIHEKGLQAACVIYSEYFHQIWMIGDCQVMVDQVLYENPKKSDLILAEMRSLIMKTQDAQGLYYDHEEARAVILPWIVKSTVFANDVNSDYGYSVINGENIPEKLIKVIELGDTAHEIILASDGYPQLHQTLEASENYLCALLKEDPECYKSFLSTKGITQGQKSFDDRTYIRFTI